MSVPMPQSQTMVSALIHSREFADQTDDSLKDEDNFSWVMRLPDAARSEWLPTLQWVRAADRLVENQGFDGRESTDLAPDGFEMFVADWRAVRRGGMPATPFRNLFLGLAERWRRDGLTETMLQPWDLYLDSLSRYQNPRFETVGDYVESLYGLSGAIYQTYPFQPRGLFPEVGASGALAQFFNNLRDLREDILRGLCYYPTDLLERFGLCREEMPDLVDRVDPRMIRMNEYLLATLVPKLRHDSEALLIATHMHASWRAMLHSACVQQSRIEYVVRACRFNPTDIETVYWPLVGDDLRHDRVAW